MLSATRNFSTLNVLKNFRRLPVATHQAFFAIQYSKIKRGIASRPIQTIAFWRNCRPNDWAVFISMPGIKKLFSVGHASAGSIFKLSMAG
jgi:hypothetical protein